MIDSTQSSTVSVGEIDSQPASGVTPQGEAQAVSRVLSPGNVIAPVASGTVLIGNTLSVTTGTWAGAPAPTFAYQWKRDGVSIVGATSSSYVVVAADCKGSTVPAITCSVTATNVLGSSSASSNSLSIVDPLVPNIAQYRADNPAIVIATGVSSLPDLLSLKPALAQATGSKQPTLITNWNTDRKALSLAAASVQFLATTAFSVNPSQPYTVFVVGECTDSNIDYVFDGIDASNRNALIANFSNSSGAGGRSEIYAGTEVGSLTADLRLVFVVMIVFNGNSSKYTINGTTILAGNPAGAQVLHGLTLGAKYDGTTPFQGKIAEICIIAGDQSANEPTKRAYLRSYHNCP